MQAIKMELVRKGFERLGFTDVNVHESGDITASHGLGLVAFWETLKDTKNHVTAGRWEDRNPPTLAIKQRGDKKLGTSEKTLVELAETGKTEGEKKYRITLKPKSADEWMSLLRFIAAQRKK